MGAEPPNSTPPTRKNQTIECHGRGPLVGRQTVPRAELGAGIATLKNTDDTRKVTIRSDCKYCVEGARKRTAKHIQGDNGDLWDEWWQAAASKKHFLGKVATDCAAGLAAADSAVDDGTAAAIGTVDRETWFIQKRFLAIMLHIAAPEADGSNEGEIATRATSEERAESPQQRTSLLRNIASL